MFIVPDECAQVIAKTHTASESLKRFDVDGVKVDVDIDWMITHESTDVVLVSFLVPSQIWIIDW